METIDKVCTVEQAQRLVSAGIVLDTERYWVSDAVVDIWILKHKGEMMKSRLYDLKNQKHIFPAVDTSELGVIFPDDEWAAGNFDFDEITFGKECGLYSVYFMKWSEEGTVLKKQFELPTEAQAKTEALIWLVSEKYLDPKEIVL